MNKTTFLFTILLVYPLTLNADTQLADDLALIDQEPPTEIAAEPSAEPAIAPATEPVPEDIVVDPITAPSNANFDALPIDSSEIKTVTNIFWNAGSIQETVKSNLPENLKTKFTRGIAGQGCDVKGVTKFEGSADTCEMSDDPMKMAKFIYNFDISCNFGTYKISVCSREERKLLNQLKVDSPERVVSEQKPLEPEST